jgi:hypothetical protein
MHACELVAVMVGDLLGWLLAGLGFGGLAGRGGLVCRTVARRPTSFHDVHGWQTGQETHS